MLTHNSNPDTLRPTLGKVDYLATSLILMRASDYYQYIPFNNVS